MPGIVSLKSVNLNLIPVLRELLRHQSVTEAGRELGRSPTAISEGLAKLRATFDDPLLVKTGSRMMLTPRAIELIQPVEDACVQLEYLIHRNSFDPASSGRMFVIAAADFYVFALGPTLVDSVATVAPGVRFRFVDLDLSLPERMALREIDVAMMPDFLFDELPLATLNHMPLLEDEVVVIMRERHPLAEEASITNEALTRFPLVAFHSNWQPNEHQVASIAHRRRIPPLVHVADALLLPYFLRDSDRVTLAPRRICDRIGGAFGLVSRPLADPEPPVRSILGWNAVQDADPAHAWLRAHIRNHLMPPVA